jgi:uncharacterized protein
MKFSLEAQRSGYHLRGYDSGQILIGNTQYRTSLLLMETHLDAVWGPASSRDLTAAHIAAIADLEPEVVIVGTGRQQVFPNLGVFARLIDAGIGFEVMDTAAACRTYTVLSAEGRRVLGAFFP